MKRKPSRVKGLKKQTNEEDPRIVFLSDWVAIDLHFELRIGMPEAQVVQVRILDPNVKSKCNYCGTCLNESEHLEVELEYKGQETELYNTVLLCRDITPCQERGFFIDSDKLSRYLTPSLIEHYQSQTLSKAVFSPLHAVRKQSKPDK